MATNWLSKLFSGGSGGKGAVGMPGGSAKYTPPNTTTKPQTNPRNAYAGRLEAMARWNSTRYNAVTGKYGTGQGSWRPMNATEAKALSPYRTGYANQYSRTQQEWLTQQNMRQLTGVQYPQMTQDEWIRRQRAAPVGYTYTPYAGWVPTPNGPNAPTTPVTGNQYGYGSGGSGGSGGYGDSGAGSLPDWYNSFLNQINWRI